MSAARQVVLGRIRAAIADVPEAESDLWRVQRAARPAVGGVVDRLVERLEDYGATVTRTPAGGVPGAVAAALRRHGARRIAVPADLPAAWRPAGVDVIEDDGALSNAALGAVDGVVTGCALAVAGTGTIVLDAGPGQGRRVLTLLPDLHVCVVTAGQVVASVDDAVAAVADVRRPITFISGPSATADIELERVEGVHGPRRLEVVLACAGTTDNRGARI